MSVLNFNTTTPAPPGGMNNISFQSDTSGNISAYDPGGPWQTWTPTITGGGSMTVSGITLQTATWLRVGAQVEIQFSASLTLGGTMADTVLVALPVPNMALIQTLTGGIALLPAGYWVAAPCTMTASATTATVWNANGASFAAGNYQVAFSGVYRVV